MDPAELALALTRRRFFARSAQGLSGMLGSAALAAASPARAPLVRAWPAGGDGGGHASGPHFASFDTVGERRLPDAEIRRSSPLPRKRLGAAGAAVGSGVARTAIKVACTLVIVGRRAFLTDRQAVQESELRVRIDNHQPIGLGHLRGNLGKMLGARNADRDGQTNLCPHAAPYLGRDCGRRTEQMGATLDVGDGLVDGNPLHQRREPHRELHAVPLRRPGDGAKRAVRHRVHES